MKILYLAHRLPDAPDKGEKIRAFHQVRALAARHEVHVFALDDDPRDRPPPAWRDAVASLTTVPLSARGALLRAGQAALCGRSLSAAHFCEPALRQALKPALGADFDVAVVYSGAMDPLALGYRPRVLDLVDVDSAKFRAYFRERTAKGLRRLAYGLEGRRLARLERKAVADADLTLVCTDPEAELLKSLAAPRRLEVVGNGVDLEAFPFGGPAGRRPAEIAFVGALDYPPNVDAAEHLVRDLLPAIRREVPAASVTLVGRSPAPEVRALAREEGVALECDVPSVVSILHRATLTLLPFRIARGIQNKALEALAAGLPLVLSAGPARALAGSPGRDFLVAEDGAGLVSCAVSVLRDPAVREDLAKSGRKLAESHYSWAGILRRFEELVVEVADGPGGRRGHRAGPGTAG